MNYYSASTTSGYSYSNANYVYNEDGIPVHKEDYYPNKTKDIANQVNRPTTVKEQNSLYK